LPRPPGNYPSRNQNQPDQHSSVPLLVNTNHPKISSPRPPLFLIHPPSNSPP